MGERIILKLTSTKFWTYLGVLAVCVVGLIKEDSEVAVQITALIAALGDCICYVFGNVQQKKALIDVTNVMETQAVDMIEEDEIED